MVKVYTDDMHLEDGKYSIKSIEKFFRSKIRNLTGEEKKIIESIENAVFLSDIDIKTPYGLCKFYEISTGTKTLICVLRYPDLIFDVTGCGRNVLTELFKIIDNKDIKIVLKHSKISIPTGVTLLVNDKVKVRSSSEYRHELYKDRKWSYE